MTLNSTQLHLKQIEEEVFFKQFFSTINQTTFKLEDYNSLVDGLRYDIQNGIYQKILSIDPFASNIARYIYIGYIYYNHKNLFDKENATLKTHPELFI